MNATDPEIERLRTGLESAIAAEEDLGARLAAQETALRSGGPDDVLDASRALLMIDTASWPAAAQPHVASGFTAPNIDVTAWFHRAEPQSEWLLTDTSCQVADGGLMGTHARIWSESGALLASGGAQLYCVPAPPG